MEEQKDKKEVKLGVVKNDNQDNNPPKYSYEELNKFCNEFYRENQILKQQLQQANATIRMFNRLDYLLRVIEVSNKQERWHFSDDFMANCIKEIEEAMTIPEEAKQEDTKEN